jgi:hypothetical protein
VAEHERRPTLATWLLIVIILAVLVAALIIGTVVFGIGTQRRDRGVTLSRRRRGPGPGAGGVS